MADALVLSGAAAQGAFTAGVLAVLSSPATKARLGLDVRRIVGTSSGALNGLYYAAAIRAGREPHAGARLARLWIEQARASRVFAPSARAMVSGRGLSSERRLLALLRHHVRPQPGSHPIELRMAVTTLDGHLADVDGEPATSFEQVVQFRGRDLDTDEGMSLAWQVAAASAALPGLFAPVPVALHGRRVDGVDGGATDNTPLDRALGGTIDIGRVFVIAAVPRVVRGRSDLRWLALASHLLNVLVQERLVRELRAVARMNAALTAIDARVAGEAQRAELRDALGWMGRRPVQVVEIRPAAPLRGNALSGFFSRSLREHYVQAGIEAAQRAVAPLSAAE